VAIRKINLQRTVNSDSNLICILVCMASTIGSNLMDIKDPGNVKRDVLRSFDSG